VEAAVGCQCSAGHEAGIFGAEEGDAARYFLWLPEAPHMFALTNAIEGFGAEIALDLFVQRRVNDAGAQQIHAYAVFGQLCGGGGRQPQLAGLGRGVCAGSGATQERVDRSDIDDRSAIARRQHSARFMLETQEIAANPKVELCYMDSKHDQVRITGKAEVLEDEPDIQEIWESNPLLSQYLGTSDNPMLIIYKIIPQQVRFMREWALEYYEVPTE